MQRTLDTIEGISSFGDFVKSDYSRRAQEIPSYSMRKYSAELKTSDSNLSQFVRGKKKFSPQLIQTLGRKLGLTSVEIAFFINQEEATKHDTVNVASSPEFLKMSDWRCDAVREFLDGKPFDIDRPTLAERLMTTEANLNEILEILQKEGSLVQEEGVWKNILADVTRILHPHETNVFAKTYQKNLLKSSLESIDNVDISLRNHTCVVLPVSLENLPAAVGMIRQFRRRFIQEFQPQEKSATDVFALQISFFPLLQPSEKNT